MDNSDSSDDEHSLSGNKTPKLQIADVGENDEHSPDEDKEKPKETVAEPAEVPPPPPPPPPPPAVEAAVKSTKPTRKRRTTSSRSRKRKSTQPRVRNPNAKPRSRVTPTGLNGNYWSAVQVDRHSNRTAFDRAELLDDEDEENDMGDDDHSSTSEDLTEDKIRPVLQKSSSESEKEEKSRPILYENRSFVTCRSPSDSFFLCQILQNVYNDTKKIRIRWCSAADEKGDEAEIDENTRFRFDFEDTLDPQAILTAIPDVIRHADKTLSLRKKDIFETNRLLEKSIKGESMLSDELQTTTESSEVKLNENIYETASNDGEEKLPKSTPKTKRRKTSTETTKKRVRVQSSGEAAPVRKRRRTKDIADISDGEKRTTKKTTPKPLATTTPKAQLFKVQSNRFLKENNAITIYRCEPFFEDDKKVPFISSSVQGKLAIRAVILEDAALLQNLIVDVNHVCSVHMMRSVENNLTAIHYAIKNNSIDLLRILLDDFLKKKVDRCPLPEISMVEQSTGTPSIRTLGFRTAKIMASRGAREGNNALTKDRSAVLSSSNGNEILLYALRNNCSREVYDMLIAAFPNLTNKVYDNIFVCIRAGHRKLAASLVEQVLKNPFHGFNALHHQSLLYDNEDIVVKFAASVTKKAKENFQITPIHCAAINPNSKYLKQFLSIMPEYNLLDKYERRPIHFAAACEGPEPLEYLLSRQVNFNDVDRGGNSPLHIAVTYGRAINAEILLRTAKEKAESNDPDDQTVHRKFGLASINRMNKVRQYPLHLAVLNNHLECVKVLLEFEAQIDVLTSTASGKITPLMLACQKGNLKIATHLVENGAKVEARDRFKRTPLIHACMCGNAHIVSYLLRLGANANAFDSSMNSALHYAVAYGWFFCVRLLIEAGANVNYVNAWQTTCLAAGFLKGHFGLCDYLLTEHKVDINFKTEDGLSLVMLTVALNISNAVVQQLEYVAVKHKADCTTVDANGRNAFHYLASNTTYQEPSSIKDEDLKILKKNFFRMAEILSENRCDPNLLDNKAQTPLMIALESGNFILVDYFINQLKLDVTADVSNDGKTLLHYFAMKCHEYELIQTLFRLSINDELKKMGQIFDEQGRTPLHYSVAKFNEFCQEHRSAASSDSLKKQYESIVRMIEFCLETIQCDPDAEIQMSKTNDADEDDNDETSSEKTIVKETSIFSLLRTVAFDDSSVTHPLEIFLKKTQNINVLHHQSRRTALLEAIHLQEIRTSQMILKESLCNVNLASSIKSNERGQTPLIAACRLQFLGIIEDLLNHPNIDLLARDYEDNQALHYFLATSQRSNEYIEKFYLFLRKLAVVNPQMLNNPGKANRTPLHIAVYHNQGSIDATVEVEQALIDRKCHLTSRDDLGNVPLHNVFLRRQIGDDPVELCVVLLKAMQNQSIDLKNNQGITPLYLAVSKASTVCITLLQKHKADVNIENNLGNTIIGNCIASNHVILLINFLSQQMKIDLSKLHTMTDEAEPIVVEETPATPTIRPRKVMAVSIPGRAPRRQLKSLLAMPSSTSQRTKKKGKTSNEEKNDRWIWKYADPNQNKISEKYSLIHMIVQRDWQGALSLILNELDRFHLKNIQIFEAAILNNKLNLLYRLLTRTRDQTIINEKNAQGQNLFHLLANINRPDESLLTQILTYLSDHRVDWNLTDKHGSFPLHYACVQQNFVFIDFLKKKFSVEFTMSQTDAFGNTAFGLLFWSTKTTSSIAKTELQSLITSGKQLDCLINYNNDAAMNPLSFGYADESITKDLSYPPTKSDNGSTTARTSPLINAIVHNHFDLVKFLLELGADVNFADYEKRTPLMHAVRQNNLDIVKVLLDKDYTPETTDTDGSGKMKRPLRPTIGGKTPRFLLGVATENEPMDTSTKNGDAEQSKTFKVTSSIDLNAKDALGRTCIHHLVQPFPDGSYINNIEMLELLYESGASVTRHDLAGLSPLQYGAINGCQHLCDALTRLSNEKKDETSVPIEQFHPNDPNTKLLDPSDFYADAQQLIDEYLTKNPSKKQNNAYEVDPLSKMTQTGEVVIDGEKNQPYDVRLTKTDVGYGLTGFYNFYRMQIIKHKSKANLFMLFTRWGRIGDGEGQYQLTPFSNLDECRKEFCKVFREKTGNLWKDSEQFQSKPKKYTLIQLNDREMCKHSDVPIDFDRLEKEKEKIPSKLQSDVYKTFFRTLINRQSIRNNLKKTRLDVEWMPLSQLKRESLQKAREILLKLKSDIEKKEKLRLENRQSKTIDQSGEIKQILDSIYRHTNEFYSIVPLQGYADEKLPMIDHENILKQQEQVLDDILELELSYKMLLGAQANLNKMSPLDYLYKSINCQFEAMNKDDMDSQLILRYIWTSSPEIEVEQIFKISRPNEDQRLIDLKLDNHYLLWHGTNICNLISILSRGLLVGSLTARTTGSLFGKGIYTSDVFAKSLDYCSGVVQSDGERCFMILCEVALGQMKEKGQNDDIDDDVTKPLDFKRFQSRKSAGRTIPDPRYTITRNYGVRMPLGQLIPNNIESQRFYFYLPYNEYIVYDEAQVALRYLVQFRR